MATFPTITDDDGTGLTGTVLNNALGALIKAYIDDPIPILEALSTDTWAQQFNNLLKAGGLPSWSAGTAAHADSVPDGWGKEGTPATFERDTADVGYGKFSVKITTDAVNEGQNQTISGLKPSTKYTIQCRAKVTAGDTARLFTTGATTNVDEETTSESWTDLTNTFTTDGSGTNVVVKAVGKANGDIVWFCGLVCTEGPIVPRLVQHPNDEHLKAIDYQSTAPANFDYGVLRMECGGCTATFGGAEYRANIVVTFGTAFTKILNCILVTYSTVGLTAAQEGGGILAFALDTTSVNPYYYTADHTNPDNGDTASMYWIVIGVGP